MRPVPARRRRPSLAAALWAGVACVCTAALAGQPPAPPRGTATIALPPPRTAGPLALESTLQARRSQRGFAPTALTLPELAQLLWAAQGRTGAQGQRTAPSAGALYPLSLIVVAGRVDDLGAGLYRYDAAAHGLRPMRPGDARSAVAAAALGQDWLREAPVLIVVTADATGTAARYGARAERFIAMEAGAAAQNLQLQAVAMGLGSVFVGGLDDAALQRALALPAPERPLLVLPVGHRP